MSIGWLQRHTKLNRVAICLGVHEDMRDVIRAKRRHKNNDADGANRTINQANGKCTTQPFCFALGSLSD
ncbi:hypothetical protein ANCDUO_07796 [Ancylostoma duodenale]|uniref:Uncharacterized protein n=1 Tax=Ancylostoma duodenale TaxID=51022 RepID=A0A0C2DHK6_9BILA|nr:hypothetical protein ANCDUO_07796 [Ancylostoma duodenale]